MKELSSSTLVAECPRCQGEFKLREATIFDGLGQYPPQALEVQSALKEALSQQESELGKRAKMADEGAEQRAVSVGLGKIFEKVIAAHKDFKYPIADCRPLYEPIDLIAFSGLSEGKVDSVTFLEVKTGKARLNKHEKMIKDAVEEGRVEYKVI